MPMSVALQTLISQQDNEIVLLALNQMYADIVAGAGNVFGSVPFSAGNFSATGAMTWTVDPADQVTYRYVQQGSFLQLWLKLNTTTVGGTVAGNNLQVALPLGLKAANSSAAPALAAPGGGALEQIVASFAVGSNIMTLLRNASNWVVGADNTSINVSVEIETQ